MTLVRLTDLVRDRRGYYGFVTGTVFRGAGDLFASLRRLAMAVVVILGAVQGPHLEFLRKFTVLLGRWLVWRF
ncbi:hypothetical protein [Amycolatopsis sp. NPDC004625]|uniref:hypothetical protein n=1 Tax=Amycolatopsis sp. NPDC004625 TaxID=3154670 RepID=UPI0033BC7411